MKITRLKTLGPRLKPFDTRTVRPPPKVVESFYTTPEWKAVREQVLKRDGYRCVKCGGRGKLYVDHIIERKDGGADFEMENLQVLDAPCHTTKTVAERLKRGARQY